MGRENNRLFTVGFGGAPGAPAPCQHCGYDLSGRDHVEPCAECGETPTCVSCGYNLASLASDAPCPECSLPVTASVAGDLAQVAGPDGLRSLHTGLTRVRLAILGQALLAIGYYVISVITTVRVSMLSQSGSAWTLYSALAYAALSTMLTLFLLWGYWGVARTPLVDADAGARAKGQTALRIGLVVAAILVAVAFLQTTTSTLLVSSDNAAAGVVKIAWSVVAGIASLGAWGTIYFSSLLVIEGAARRLPDRALMRRAKRILWLGPTVVVVGTVLDGGVIFVASPLLFMGSTSASTIIFGLLGFVGLFLGPLIALAMYWNTLNRLRKDVKRVVRAVATADAAAAAVQV